MNHYYELYHWTIYKPIHVDLHSENENKITCTQKVKWIVLRLKLI